MEYLDCLDDRALLSDEIDGLRRRHQQPERRGGGRVVGDAAEDSDDGVHGGGEREERILLAGDEDHAVGVSDRTVKNSDSCAGFFAHLLDQLAFPADDGPHLRHRNYRPEHAVPRPPRPLLRLRLRRRRARRRLLTLVRIARHC